MRELRGIGRGIESRLRELVETGRSRELEELERELAPDLVGLGRYLGLSARRSVDLARALGVRTADELREAAAAGRLRSSGNRAQDRGAADRGARARGRAATTARPAAQPRAGSSSARHRGGARRGARRRRAALARLCEVAGRGLRSRRIRRPARALRGAAADRRADRARRAARGRRHGRGRADRADGGGARAFGTELVRATGSPAYVRQLEPLPDAPDEEAVYRALGVPWCPPELREEPFHGEPPELVEAGRHPRRPALPHDLVGRPRERRGDGPRRARARLRLPRDLRPHPRRGRRQGADARRGAPPGRRDRRRERAARAVPAPARDRVRHPSRRPARPPRRRARRARLGAGERPRRPADAARRR